MTTQDLAKMLDKQRAHWRTDSNEEIALRYAASELRMMERKIMALEEEVRSLKVKVKVKVARRAVV